ncbi:MAG: DUF3179 domain-containing protein [Pseudomonadota bacterium]
MSVIRLILLLSVIFVSTGVQAEESPDILELSWQMFAVQGEEKKQIAEKLAALGDRSLIPTFVLAMRWTRNNIYVAEGLTRLAGEEITDWHDAYVWQERHPEIVPHETFRAIKLRFLEGTDARFGQLFELPHGTRDKMKIRLEEISWGGARFDSIPPLDNPAMIEAPAADYIQDTDLVFGVEINGDARAYPLRILGWHEMLNETIGGVPVALAYCTLCGAGILFETVAEGSDEPLVFGSSGLLYRSNKLMFDRATNSLWNQFTGEPVVGPLAESDVRLRIRPLIITSWKDWKSSHPDTRVLSLNTGFYRDYGSGVVYREYFSNPELMFPASVGDESEVSRKEFVFGIREFGAAKAWPVEAFREKRVINDRVGQTDVVLIGDAKTRTVRAYVRNPDETFEQTSDGELKSDHGVWRTEEDFLVSLDGSQRRARVPGHVSYWFAWDNYLGVRSELYSQ